MVPFVSAQAVKTVAVPPGPDLGLSGRVECTVQDGLVELRVSGMGVGTRLAQLPAGYRPQRTLLAFPDIAEDEPKNLVQVTPDGTVTLRRPHQSPYARRLVWSI